MRLSETISEDPFWSENRLATPLAIRRMRDIEFVSDLLIGVLHGPQAGNAKTLDQYYAIYEDYEPMFPKQRNCRMRFNCAFELIQEILPDIRRTRWANKTDFYSLFVALAHLRRSKILPGDEYEELRETLDDFEADVQKYLDNSRRPVSDEVSDYVEAVRRGSSDRSRRGVRHQALLKILMPHFRKRRSR